MRSRSRRSRCAVLRALEEDSPLESMFEDTLCTVDEV